MQPHDPPPPDADRVADPPARKTASLRQVVSAGFWSFFGIRKGNAMSRDMVTIKPLHVIIVGIALAAIFVVSLITLVRIITRAG